MATVRRHGRAVLLVAALAGGVSYAVSTALAPVYTATTTLLSTSAPTANSTVNSILVSAPPLPQGALERALASPEVVAKIVRGLNRVAVVGEAEHQALAITLSRQQRSGQMTTFDLRGRPDASGNGVYDLRASYHLSAGAAALANIAAQELVRWDVERAKQKVTQARKALEAELLGDRFTAQETPGQRRAAPNQPAGAAKQAALYERLETIRALERAVAGTLTILAPASPPDVLAQPRPLRNGLVGASLGLLTMIGVVLARARNLLGNEAASAQG